MGKGNVAVCVTTRELIEAHGRMVGQAPDAEAGRGLWAIERDGLAGRVSFEGEPGFTCRYMPVDGYGEEHWSQEFAFHNERDGLVYFDFEWLLREALPSEIDALMRRVGRVIKLGPAYG